MFRLLFIPALLAITLLGSDVQSSDELSEKLTAGKDVYIRNVEFEEDIDLTDLGGFAYAYPGTKQLEVKGNVVFDSCVFKGFSAYDIRENIKYQTLFDKNLVFNNCIFEGDLDLSYARIDGNFLMSGSKVSGELLLRNTLVKGRNTDLTALECFERVKITNSIFENDFSALKAKFHSPVIMQGSTFKGEALFNAASFNDYAVFSKSTFLMDCSFSEAYFYTNAVFNHMDVRGDAEFTEAKFKGKADFSDAIFHGRVNSGNAEFSGQLIKSDTIFINETDF